MLTDIIAQINKTSLQNENGNNKEIILSPDACVLTAGFPKTSFHFLFVYCRYLVQKFFLCSAFLCSACRSPRETRNPFIFVFSHASNKMTSLSLSTTQRIRNPCWVPHTLLRNAFRLAYLYF